MADADDFGSAETCTSSILEAQHRECAIKVMCSCHTEDDHCRSNQEGRRQQFFQSVFVSESSILTKASVAQIEKKEQLDWSISLFGKDDKGNHLSVLEVRLLGSPALSHLHDGRSRSQESGASHGRQLLQ